MSSNYNTQIAWFGYVDDYEFGFRVCQNITAFGTTATERTSHCFKMYDWYF